MGCKARKISMGLAWGCALLIGASLTSCASPQYKYLADSSQNTYYKVPYSWQAVPQSQLCAIPAGQTASPCASAWISAFEADSSPNLQDLGSSRIGQPFVYVEVAQVASTVSGTLTDDKLRDSVLPISATGRQTLQEEGITSLTNFRQLRDSLVSLPHGVYGVRDTYDYTLAGGVVDTFDQIALTNQDQTTLWLIFLHCTTQCYSQDTTAIDAVMSSFTVRS